MGLKEINGINGPIVPFANNTLSKNWSEMTIKLISSGGRRVDEDGGRLYLEETSCQQKPMAFCNRNKGNPNCKSLLNIFTDKQSTVITGVRATVPSCSECQEFKDGPVRRPSSDFRYRWPLR